MLDEKNMLPREALRVRMGERTFLYNDPFILDGLKARPDLNKTAVRFCRIPRENEGHKGRVKVQFLRSGIETFAKPENLFEVTEELRACLSDDEKTELHLLEESNKDIIGIDPILGGVCYNADKQKPRILEQQQQHELPKEAPMKDEVRAKPLTKSVKETTEGPRLQIDGWPMAVYNAGNYEVYMQPLKKGQEPFLSEPNKPLTVYFEVPKQPAFEKQAFMALSQKTAQERFGAGPSTSEVLEDARKVSKKKNRASSRLTDEDDKNTFIFCAAFAIDEDGATASRMEG
tara:strand:+ start:973 stop:1836 length:864 start_codon:yes stop_codon:yes gene_type:complete